MAYEIYKRIKSKDEFLKNHSGGKSEGELEEIYRRYVNKCNVLQRDNFTCQNENCPYCKNIKEHPELTIHHVKFLKNNGADKERNCVTICNEAHKEFHRGMDVLTFWGKTFQIHTQEKMDWKRICRENKKLRKELKKSLERERYSAELIRMLMRFLTTHYKDLQGGWSSQV